MIDIAITTTGTVCINNKQTPFRISLNHLTDNPQEEPAVLYAYGKRLLLRDNGVLINFFKKGEPGFNWPIGSDGDHSKTELESLQVFADKLIENTDILMCQCGSLETRVQSYYYPLTNSFEVLGLPERDIPEKRQLELLGLPTYKRPKNTAECLDCKAVFNAFSG